MKDVKILWYYCVGNGTYPGLLLYLMNLELFILYVFKDIFNFSSRLRFYKKKEKKYYV